MTPLSVYGPSRAFVGNLRVGGCKLTIEQISAATPENRQAQSQAMVLDKLNVVCHGINWVIRLPPPSRIRQGQRLMRTTKQAAEKAFIMNWIDEVFLADGRDVSDQGSLGEDNSDRDTCSLNSPPRTKTLVT